MFCLHTGQPARRDVRELTQLERWAFRDHINSCNWCQTK